MSVELNSIFQSAIDAVSPEKLFSEQLSYEDGSFSIHGFSIDLKTYGNCYLCGSGKAAMSMAKAVEKSIGEYLGGGIIVTPDQPEHLQHVTSIQSTHPLPSQESIDAADAMMNLFQSAHENDVIIYLLSGGTSALLEKPLNPLTLDDMIQTTKILLENGCSIEEINGVRKHLSAIKGGRLGQMTKARVVVMVISDVIGDDLQTIGSAPLYSDASTYEEIYELLQMRHLFELLPENVQKLIQSGVDGEVLETPSRVPANVTHLLIASNSIALAAAKRAAVDMGLNVCVEQEPLMGSVEAAVEGFMERFSMIEPGTVLICGGETTVTVKGSGRGGRNQHFALLCLEGLADRFNYEMICAGTDGIDGNSDAAGAYISNHLYQKAEEMGIDIAKFRDQYDSNTLFATLDTLIKTGYTGTNVMDIVIAYKGE